MSFKNLRFSLIVRVLLLSGTALLLAYYVYGSGNQVNIFFIALAFVIQVFALIRTIEKSNREISNFLSSIKYDDFTATYPEKGNSSSVDQLYKEFNNVIKKFREIRADKEANYHYFRTIVQHVGIGLITFNKQGEVQIINSSAKKLIGIEGIQNINELSKVSPKLVESLMKLKTGGSDLINFTQNGTHTQLSIYVIELILRGEEFKLVSVQNIQSELEEKEMEAWQNLIRVLTHEIMNSITPLSSLAATVRNNLVDNIEDNVPIEKEELEDIYLAVETIERRSQGLIRFVTDFRNLTRIPQPNLAQESIKGILDHVKVLFNFEFEKKKVKFSLSIEPTDLKCNIDKELIDQVLINLLQNAIHALEENVEEKHILIKAFINEYN
ncbi:MAG: nitrogen fixation/metabolism regulation signal transduction histidine kinase, partial [Roseivirga sp.]